MKMFPDAPTALKGAFTACGYHDFSQTPALSIAQEIVHSPNPNPRLLAGARNLAFACNSRAGRGNGCHADVCGSTLLLSLTHGWGAGGLERLTTGLRNYSFDKREQPE